MINWLLNSNSPTRTNNKEHPINKKHGLVHSQVKGHKTEPTYRYID